MLEPVIRFYFEFWYLFSSFTRLVELVKEKTEKPQKNGQEKTKQKQNKTKQKEKQSDDTQTIHLEIN